MGGRGFETARGLVDVALSVMVGEAEGERRFTRWVCVALAGVASVERCDGSGVVFPGVSLVGWPDARSVLPRLGLTPAELSELWFAAVAAEGRAALLPERVLEGLFPAPAREVAAVVVGVGPVVFVERLEVFCRREALRAAPVTRARPGGGRISEGTVEAVLSGGRRFCRVVSGLARREIGGGLLEAWRWLPDPVAAARLGARPAYTDRSAPPVERVRRVIDGYGEAIAATRRGTAQRRRLLRTRLLVALLAATGARVGALARLQAGDYRPDRRSPQGHVGPALRLRPGKTLPAHAVRWKHLPAEIADWLEHHLHESQLDPHAPLFPMQRDPARPMTPDSLTKLLTTGPARLSIGASAHTLRHLAEQLAYTTPTRTAAHPAQAYPDALLDHAFTSDPLGYRDSERQREDLARHATNHIWRTLRTTPTSHPPTLELRQTRHHLLNQPLGALTDRKLLEALHEHARLTALIDDQ